MLSIEFPPVIALYTATPPHVKVTHSDTHLLLYFATPTTRERGVGYFKSFLSRINSVKLARLEYSLLSLRITSITTREIMQNLTKRMILPNF